MALVLSTDVDRALLKTRALMLERAGHRVISAVGESDIRAACLANTIEIAIIGQTMPKTLKLWTFALVREHCPSAKVLELFPPFKARILTGADGWLEMPAPNPQTFVDAVKQLAELPAAK